MDHRGMLFFIIYVLMPCVACGNILKQNNWFGSQSKRAVFKLNDTSTPDINVLTKDLKVGDEYRYPCYVSVVVYNSPEMPLRSYKDGANITVITKDRPTSDKTTNYVGFSSVKTDVNGYACILTLCRKTAIIYVTAGTQTNSNEERLYALQDQSSMLPRGYTYIFQSRNEELLFNVKSWGTIAGRTGPVYNEHEEALCLGAGISDYHFGFSFLGIKEKLQPSLPLDTHFKLDAWYYYDDFDPSHRYCFVKIKIMTASYNAKVVLQSSTENSQTLYGTYEAGPKPSPTSGDSSIKAACMEFRCALKDDYDVPMPTKLTGMVTIPSHPCGCKITEKVDGVFKNATSFMVDIHVNDNYGPNDGIYENQKREYAKSLCYTGTNDYLPNYKMNPDVNYFIEYDCMAPCPAPSLTG